MQLNKELLQEIMKQDQKYKIIIYLIESDYEPDQDVYYVNCINNEKGLRLNDKVEQNQFIIMEYIYPSKTNNNKAIEFINLLCPILSTFIIFEQNTTNSLKQSFINFNEFDKSFLPNGYQISQLNIHEEDQSIGNTNNIKEVLQNLHEIYLNSDDNLDYIVNQFLINSYQYKRIKTYGIDNSTNFKRFIGFIFKNVQKYIETGLYKYIRKMDYLKICNEMAIEDIYQQFIESIKMEPEINRSQLIDKQIGKYERLTEKMNIELKESQKQKIQYKMDKYGSVDKQDDFELNIHTFRSDSQSVYVDNSEPKHKEDDVMQPDVTFFDNKQQKESDDHFDQILEKEFNVIKQKLIKNEYSNYDVYENDLQIFINFCFDNILDLQYNIQNDSKFYLDYVGFSKIKQIYDFIMNMNREGAQHFIKRIQNGQLISIHESINMNNSQDDLTIIHNQDNHLDDIMSNIQDWQMKLQQSFSLINQQSQTNGQQQLYDNYSELEMKGRLMESVIRTQYHQIQKQNQLAKKYKVSHSGGGDNQKYFYNRIIELENESEELRQRNNQQQNIFVIKENKYKDQIDRLNNMMSQLSMQNMKNSTEIDQEKTQLYQKQNESVKIMAQLNSQIENMELEKQRLTQQIRETKGQQELRNKENMLNQQQQLDTINELQNRIQNQEDMMQQLQKERRIEFDFVQQNDNMKIYKQMNKKLEEENERLIREVNETLMTIKDYSVQIDNYQRQIQGYQEKQGQYESRMEELDLNHQESKQQYLELENGYIQQIQQLKVDYEQEIQQLNRENIDLKENYELRIQKIKKQIIQNNPFMNIDDNLNISNNEQTMQNMNNSLINLINNQQNQTNSNINNSRINRNESLDIFNNSRSNVLEGKVQDYQNKIKNMQEEKNQLLVKVDEIYQKYIEANLNQNQQNSVQQIELQNHVEILKQKLKQEISDKNINQTEQLSRIMESDYLLNRMNSSYLNNNHHSQLSTQYSKNRMINDKERKYESIKQSNYQKSKSIQNTHSNTNRSYLNDRKEDNLITNMNLKTQQNQQKLETKINSINNTDNLKKHLAQIINKSPINRSPLNREKDRSRDYSPINFNNMKQTQLKSNKRLNSQTNFMKLSNQMNSSGMTVHQNNNNRMKGSLFDNYSSNRPLNTLLNDSSGLTFKSSLLRQQNGSLGDNPYQSQRRNLSRLDDYFNRKY